MNYGNSDIESIFLSKTGGVVNTRKKSSASASRILTLPEIIQAKKENEEIKEQKAKAAQQTKIRVEERKKKTKEKVG